MFIVDPLEFVRDDHRTRLRAAVGYRAVAPASRPARRHRWTVRLHTTRRAA